MSDKRQVWATVKTPEGPLREVRIEVREKDSEVLTDSELEAQFDFSCFYYGYGERISPIQTEYTEMLLAHQARRMSNKD